jgi:hypothetical protein
MSYSHSPEVYEGEPRNRFPTLFEVLSRKTVAPLDLFSFYIYMRDSQRSVDYLDFWWDSSVTMAWRNTNNPQARRVSASATMSALRAPPSSLYD